MDDEPVDDFLFLSSFLKNDLSHRYFHDHNCFEFRYFNSLNVFVAIENGPYQSFAIEQSYCFDSIDYFYRLFDSIRCFYAILL